MKALIVFVAMMAMSCVVQEKEDTLRREAFQPPEGGTCSSGYYEVFASPYVEAKGCVGAAELVGCINNPGTSNQTQCATRKDDRAVYLFPAINQIDPEMWQLCPSTTSDKVSIAKSCD